MNLYDAVPPETDYRTYFRKQHNGYWGDVEWHTTPHIEPAEYYPISYLRWPVRSIATSVSAGEVVCGYSRVQDRRFCDTVYRTSVSQENSRNLVAMTNQNMVGGDSGGPWSYYDKAYGIVKGYTTINFGRRDTWTKASNFGPALGVQVRTQ